MYKEDIQLLVQNHPLGINTDVLIESKVPTSVSSEFITNKEQGDWAERIVFDTINNENSEYIAIRYGRMIAYLQVMMDLKSFMLITNRNLIVLVNVQIF